MIYRQYDSSHSCGSKSSSTSKELQEFIQSSVFVIEYIAAGSFGDSVEG